MNKYIAFEIEQIFRTKQFDFITKIEQERSTQCVSIFLRVLVLQTYSHTECINNPTCRVESPTELF